jgi:hypothetical protein
MEVIISLSVINTFTKDHSSLWEFKVPFLTLEKCFIKYFCTSAEVRDSALEFALTSHT